MDVYFSPAFNDTSVAADTTRKATAIAASLHDRPVVGVRLVEPDPATIDEVEQVHSARYVRALLTGDPVHLAESNGLGWDERLMGAVLASTGGVRAAVLSALSSATFAGSLSSGLHHARRDRGYGYCTVNGLVVGAVAAQANGAGRVLIVDFDAHCGGGTAGLIDGLDGIEQIDVSVNSFDSYESRPDAKLVLSSATTYLDDVEAALDAVPSPTSIDLVIYNAGMDPHERAGGVRGIDAEILAAREQRLFEWASALRLPVAWVLAGGYTGAITMDELVELHRLTITAAASNSEAH